jgi:hypothetical protein
MKHRTQQERILDVLRSLQTDDLLGIDIRRITEISRSGRRRHRMAAVEYPSVIARIHLIRKSGAAALMSFIWSVHERAATAEQKR